MNTLDAIAEGRRNKAGGVSPPLPLTVSALLVFAAYYLGAKFGLALTFEPYPISVLWPPNAILFGALLIAPLRWWPALLLAAFPAHLLAELQSGVPARMVLCWFVSNASEALIGAGFVRYALGGVPALQSLREAVVLAGGALISAFVSSFIDAAFVIAVGRGELGYWELWSTRLHSNVLATLVFVPVIVTWMTLSPAALQSLTRTKLAEAILLTCGLVAAAIFAFGLPAPASAPPALLYLPLPFLLWAALRFGTAGASSAFMLVAVVVIWCAGHGRGPFADGDAAENARAVQYFLIFVGATMLTLAAIVEERRRVERELRRSEGRFASAFRASPDAIAIVHKSDGRLVEANDRWLALFQHRREEFLDAVRPGFRLYAHDKGHVEMGELARERGRIHDLEVPLQTRNGDELQVLLSVEDLEVDGEACLISIVRDITDRKRAIEANERLAHVSRLAVMGELTASIAHEINQPLGAILSNADAAEMLLASETVPRAELKHILDDIRRDDLRVSDVVQHMRMLMRKRELTMEPFDLNRAISDVLQLLSADLAKRRVTVTTRFAPLPIVRGDHVHVQQVVMNLILNALDAMSGGAAAGRRVDVTTQLDGDRAQVTVGDNGPGLKPEHLPRLFDSFFTTKDNGMGLGLSIARSIVEAHGGRIWAENGPWVGARFHFTLCIAPGCAPRRGAGELGATRALPS